MMATSYELQFHLYMLAVTVQGYWSITHLLLKACPFTADSSVTLETLREERGDGASQCKHRSC